MTRLAAVTVLLAATLGAQQLSYPEGNTTPRSLTRAEAEYLRDHPLAAPEAVTPPPTGPVHCAAEYEPMDGILLAWEGSASWQAILRQMAVAITTVGQARAYVVVDTASEQTTVTSTLAAAGADMARVRFLVTPTDTIWIRDYGPRYIFEGDCRAIADHTYNRPRPADDTMPAALAAQRRHTFYEHPLIHGGGNYHLDALRRSYCTRLINNENPTRSEAQIRQIWLDYQDVDTTFFTPFPTSVDSTQHLDMWMQVAGDDVVMISDWPANAGSTQDQICDAAAVFMAGRGYTVHRVPARSVSGVHYTYTNVVMCNDLLLLPTYSNSSVAPHNAEARTAWAAALPGKTIVQVDCQAIVTSAGVMHCIAMHVPRHRGGVSPTAYLRTHNGGPALTPNATVEVLFNVDDDEAPTSCDLWLSANGGASFAFPLAMNLPPTGRYLWTVPDLAVANARLRVVARDAQGRLGHDDSDASFTISGTGCRASVTAFGVGKAGSFGVPTLVASALPRLGATVNVDLAQAWRNTVAVLLAGGTRVSFPFDGGTVLASPDLLLPVATDAGGAASVPLTVPDLASLCDGRLVLQAWVAGDPGAGGLGLSASAGLELTLGL